MSRVTVLGAGVIGSVYAALLAGAGNEVSVVARGRRLAELRRSGLRVELDGQSMTPAVAPVESMTTDDILVVAVRGDQLRSVIDGIAGSGAATILMFANPLGLRDQVERQVGRDRLVWCFAGVGGSVVAGRVLAHRGGQQATVAEVGQSRSTVAERLLAPTDRKLRREPDMAAWLDTHAVFVAGMAGLIEVGIPTARGARIRAATRLVTGMRDGFRALERRGTHVTPGNLRTIFCTVPTPIAARYWAHQLGRPTVTVSMVPHALATRDTEQPAVRDYALQLVGLEARRYRELVAGT